MMQSSGTALAKQRLNFGLKQEEVALSKSRYGANQLTQKKSKGFFASLVGNLGDPMIKVLLIALVVNMVFLFGHSNWYESLGILAAVLIAVTVSTVSEMGSEAAFARLQKEAQNTKVRVRRDGETIIIPVTELVVGDIVILNAGDRIPADGRIVSGKISVDQSSLNGESKDAQKAPDFSATQKANALSSKNSNASTDFSTLKNSNVSTEFSAQKNSNPPKNATILNKTSISQDISVLKKDKTKRSKKSDKAQSINAFSESVDFLAPSLLFCGTVVTAGECIMEVTSVGDNTAYGRLAAEVQEATPSSPLKQKLTSLAKKISFYGYIGAGFVALSYIFNGLVIKNSFDFQKILEDIKDFKQLFSLIIGALTLAVTVIVMAVPEGLPMMITVALSSNMRRMLKDNVLVRKLSGIETAGSMNILFTDKTGTLTYGMPEVMCVIDALGKEIDTDNKKTGASSFQKLLAASLMLNNSAEMIKGKAVGGNTTDRAIMEYVTKSSINLEGYTKIITTPFDSAKKFMSTKVRVPSSSIGAGELTLIKGAPEKILALCSHYYKEDKIVEYTSQSNLKKVIEELSGQAARLIAVAVSKKDLKNGELSEGLVLVGLVAIRDRIRREAKKGVKQVTDAGIQTVMITGDSKATAVAIALETGILSSKYQPNAISSESGKKIAMHYDSEKKTVNQYDSDREIVLTSDELNKMSDEELKNCLKNLRVVARALPSDKSRLVKIAQSMNLVAGMTGDGVNDAPALKKADIGFAMGSGTEVAKEAGDVVILDDNILSISRAVLYGRTIFKSIRKFIIFQMSINFCAMAVSIIAPLINAPMPITVIQMLWINLVIDTLAGLAYCGERPRAKYMQEKPKRRDEEIINRHMFQQIVVTGSFTAIVSLWFLKSNFAQRMSFGRGEAYVMTAFFTMFMFMAIFNSFCARTHQIKLWDYLSLNKQFIFIMTLIAAIQIMLIYFGGALFSLVKLEFKHLALIILISLSVIPVDLIRKLLLQKNSQKDLL